MSKSEYVCGDILRKICSNEPLLFGLMNYLKSRSRFHKSFQFDKLARAAGEYSQPKINITLRESKDLFTSLMYLGIGYFEQNQLSSYDKRKFYWNCDPRELVEAAFGMRDRIKQIYPGGFKPPDNFEVQKWSEIDDRVIRLLCAIREPAPPNMYFWPIDIPKWVAPDDRLKLLKAYSHILDDYGYVFIGELKKSD